MTSPPHPLFLYRNSHSRVSTTLLIVSVASIWVFIHTTSVELPLIFNFLLAQFFTLIPLSICYFIFIWLLSIIQSIFYTSIRLLSIPFGYAHSTDFSPQSFILP
jgi:hypothetical protein